MERSRPYIILSAAITLDGKLGIKNKRTKLSSKTDKIRVHKLRSEVDAIIIGKNSPSNPVNISSDPFTPGFTGGGWQLNSVDASITATDMTLRGTLSVYELLIQQIRATNGSIFVSASAKVDTLTGSAYTETIVFEE